MLVSLGKAKDQVQVQVTMMINQIRLIVVNMMMKGPSDHAPSAANKNVRIKDNRDKTLLFCIISGEL